MIRAENLCVVRKGAVLLNDISCHLEPGELVAVIGPNGAGKSTLVKCLVGLEKTTSGQMFLQQRPIASYTPRERARHISYIAQQQEFLWDLTVLEVVTLGAKTPGAAEGILAHLALREFSDRRIKSLSGGERARVMLARALAAQASLLIADEPAAHLDVGQQRAAMAAIRQEVRRRALGALVVIHDLNLAFTFADRILLLDNGRLTLDNAADQALHAQELDQAFNQSFIRVEVGGRFVVFPEEQVS